MEGAARERGEAAAETGALRGLRVAVAGARRVRQGTGPFLARQVAESGASLCGVVGTTQASAEAARRGLEEAGIETRAYAGLAQLVAAEDPAALVLASPSGTHGPLLDEALALGLHVLCEKPLLAGHADASATVAGQAARAAELARSFAAAGRLLRENSQWPWTLPAFRSLHPGFEPAKAARFAMRLSPGLRGRARWVDTLSHPLSLLQAVLPEPPVLEEIRYEEEHPDAPLSTLSFRCRAGAADLECAVHCVESGEFPRPAEYSWNGRLCRRIVHQPGYRIAFTDGRAESEPGDPMRLRLEDFLRSAAAGETDPDDALVHRQALHARLMQAYDAGP